VPPGYGPPDPVALLEEQDTTREPALVPVRQGRMMASPFTFHRDAAKIMAAEVRHSVDHGADTLPFPHPPGVRVGVRVDGSLPVDDPGQSRLTPELGVNRRQ